MSDQATKTGRKPGTLGEGSLTARLLALKVGESVLMPDVGNHPFNNYLATVKRAKAQDPSGDWTLETCSGFAKNMDSMPFNFYRMTRTQ